MEISWCACCLLFSPLLFWPRPRAVTDEQGALATGQVDGHHERARFICIAADIDTKPRRQNVRRQVSISDEATYPTSTRRGSPRVSARQTTSGEIWRCGHTAHPSTKVGNGGERSAQAARHRNSGSAQRFTGSRLHMAAGPRGLALFLLGEFRAVLNRREASERLAGRELR
jgi:hypothetical protein